VEISRVSMSNHSFCPRQAESWRFMLAYWDRFLYPDRWLKEASQPIVVLANKDPHSAPQQKQIEYGSSDPEAALKRCPKASA